MNFLPNCNYAEMCCTTPSKWQSGWLVGSLAALLALDWPYRA